MKKLGFVTDIKVYIAFFIAFIITLVLFPIEGKFKYKYQKGRAWNYETLVAPVDFPILKTADEFQADLDEKAS